MMLMARSREVGEKYPSDNPVPFRLPEDVYQEKVKVSSVQTALVAQYLNRLETYVHFAQVNRAVKRREGKQGKTLHGLVLWTWMGIKRMCPPMATF